MLLSINLPMNSYSYRIERRSGRLGGGWRLQLLENRVEVVGRVFPAQGGNRQAAKRAYVEALDYAKRWLASRNSEILPGLVLNDADDVAT